MDSIPIPEKNGIVTPLSATWGKWGWGIGWRRMMRWASRVSCCSAQPPCCTAPAGGSRPRATWTTTRPRLKQEEEIWTVESLKVINRTYLLQSGASYLSQGFEYNILGSSSGWLADTVATYCPGRPSQLTWKTKQNLATDRTRTPRSVKW